MTAVVAEPLTTAVNWAVCEVVSDALEGVTETLTDNALELGVIATIAVDDFDGLATLVAVTVTLCWVTVRVAGAV